MDDRSLALFRVFIALTTLWDLGDRARDLTAHYTDEGPIFWPLLVTMFLRFLGVMPRHLVLEDFYNPQWLCVYMWSGTFWGTCILFAVHALVAASLLVGYRWGCLCLDAAGVCSYFCGQVSPVHGSYVGVCDWHNHEEPPSGPGR